jgi:hypothetical protein
MALLVALAFTAPVAVGARSSNEAERMPMTAEQPAGPLAAHSSSEEARLVAAAGTATPRTVDMRVPLR